MSPLPLPPPTPPLITPPFGDRALWVIVVSFGITVAGVVLVAVWGRENTLALVTALTGMLSLLTTGFFSIIRGQQQNHSALNSRLTEFVDTARGQARAEGILEAQSQHESAARAAAQIAADVATASAAVQSKQEGGDTK